MSASHAPCTTPLHSGHEALTTELDANVVRLSSGGCNAGLVEIGLV